MHNCAHTLTFRHAAACGGDQAGYKRMSALQGAQQRRQPFVADGAASSLTA